MRIIIDWPSPQSTHSTRGSQLDAMALAFKPYGFIRHCEAIVRKRVASTPGWRNTNKAVGDVDAVAGASGASCCRVESVFSQ